MQIHLHTSFENTERELETSSTTLKELLRELLKQYPSEKFYNRDWEDVPIHYSVELNGTHHDMLPRELDTKLKDGDKVEIYRSAEFEED